MLESLRKAWKMELKIECPHCGAPHEISVRKFFIEGAVQRQPPSSTKHAL